MAENIYDCKIVAGHEMNFESSTGNITNDYEECVPKANYSTSKLHETCRRNVAEVAIQPDQKSSDSNKWHGKAVVILSVLILLCCGGLVVSVILIWQLKNETLQNIAVIRGMDNTIQQTRLAFENQRHLLDNTSREMGDLQITLQETNQLTRNQKNRVDSLLTQHQDSKANFDLLKNFIESETGTLQSDISRLGSVLRNNYIRLSGNGTSYGRVEINYQGEWGTVCDDDWDIKDARVICNMLGYSNATSAPMFARYGEGSGKIWFDDVDCTGIEPTIWQCASSPLGNHNCQHYEDASVICI